MATTSYAPRVAKEVTLSHRLIPKRSGRIDWSGLELGGKGALKIVQVREATGLWTIAQKHYGGTNVEIKERLRILRQANPSWMDWTGQLVPAGTALVLPPAARQFAKVPGAGKIVVDRGDSLSNIIARHYKKSRGVSLSSAQVVQLVPSVALLNGIHDLDNELEPGWELYLPDEAVDYACGTTLCKSDAHETTAPDTLGETEIQLTFADKPEEPKGPKKQEGDEKDLSTIVARELGEEVVARALANELVGDIKLVRDALQSKRIMIRLIKDAAGRTTEIRIKGSNRELARALGLKGTKYRVGSVNYELAMKAYAKQTGQMASQTSKLATSMAAVRSLAKGTLIGVGVTLVATTGEYVIRGESDKILTREFAVDAANDVTDNLIATGAGVAASALTVAYMSAACGSVVPGVGTAVGFLVGLGVGVALAHSHRKWFK